MSLAKVGLHILSGYAGNLGKPRIVKLVNPDAAYIRQVRAEVGEGCTIVVRWTEKEQPLDSPVENVRVWFTRRWPLMVDAAALYEGYNEVADSQAAPFAAFEVERLRLMHQVNRRSAVGSWSVGVPDLPVWATYTPVLGAMGVRDAVALHEYWSDGADLTNVWHVGRWRLVPQLAGKSIVVSECGRDRVEGRGYSGWHLDPNCTPNQYLAELRAYGNILDAYPNVIGATVFTAGQIVDPQWQPFSVNEIAPIIAAEGTQEQAQEPPTHVARLKHPLVYSRISQRFGANPAYYAPMAGHNGLDLAVPSTASVREWHGWPVVAAHDGKALIVDDPTGYGKYVYVWGNDGLDTLYAHLCWASLPPGEYVKTGDLIGSVGYTGNVKPLGLMGTHLHFAVRPRPYKMDNGYRGYVDPEPYIVA